MDKIQEKMKYIRGFNCRMDLNCNGDKLLHICAEYGQLELFTWFKEYYNADVNCQNEAGETPLMIACREGKIKIVNYYLRECKREFGINKKSKDGWTCLTYAAINGFGPVLETLLRNSEIDVNLTDRFIRNPLHWACRFNNVKVAKILLIYGVKSD